MAWYNTSNHYICGDLLNGQCKKPEETKLCLRLIGSARSSIEKESNDEDTEKLKRKIRTTRELHRNRGDGLISNHLFCIFYGPMGRYVVVPGTSRHEAQRFPICRISEYPVACFIDERTNLEMRAEQDRLIRLA